MEYTLLTIAALLVTGGLHAAFTPKQRLGQLASSSLVVLAFQFVFDNFAVWRGFWVFNDAMASGIRAPFLPIENLGFGLALFWLVVFLFDRAGP